MYEMVLYILHKDETSGVFEFEKLVMIRAYLAKMFNLFNSAMKNTLTIILFFPINDIEMEGPQKVKNLTLLSEIRLHTYKNVGKNYMIIL